MKLTLKQRSCLESEILKHVRAQPGISRIALARSLQIAPSTVGTYVGRLLAEDFLAESEKMEGAAGRPATALRLNPDGGQFVGVDFEARSIMAMSVDFSARPLRRARRDIQRSDSVRRILSKIEQTLLQVLPDKEQELLAIGVGVPGLVDPVKGVALEYKYIPGWRDIELATPLARRFGVPVYLENTIRSMALAELWFGQGRGVGDWVCIGIRSGIGAGIVAGGCLHRGVHYQAGEIGRWRCPSLSGAAARFFTSVERGRQKSLELQEIASARALLAAWERGENLRPGATRSASDERLAFGRLVRAARKRDPLTLQIIGVAAEALGWAVSQLALALNPSRVILSGPLTLLGNSLLHPLQKRAREILQGCGTEVPAIENSTMGEYIGAWGAAALALHEWKPTCSPK